MPLPREYLNPARASGNAGVYYSPVGIIKQKWTNPATADTDGFSVSHAGAAAASTRDMTLGGALAGINDFARNVVITVTHGSSVVAMSGTIYGTDVNGGSMTEDWSVTAGGTSKTFTGNKGFKTVTRITETVAADASTNTIIAGNGVKLGFNTLNSTTSPVKEYSAGSLVTNGTLVAGSTTATADPRGTYSPNSAPNGSTEYIVYYLSDNPSNQVGGA